MAKIALLLILAEITYPQLVLARMIETEGFLDAPNRQEAANALIDTVYNRIDKGWCDSVPDCMSAYHGYWWFIPKSASIEAVRDYRPIRDDIVYAFNKDDCHKLELDHSEADFVVGPFFFFGPHTEF